MNYAIIEDNVIKNVIVADDQLPMPNVFPLPAGKWIGDRYDDTMAIKDDIDILMLDLFAEHEERLCLLELTK